MSFNITSDGSPTPRKGAARVPRLGDLKIDTSPEVLSRGAGEINQNHHQENLFRDFGLPLTSNLQALNRTQGSAALSNNTKLQPTTSFEDFKKPRFDADPASVEALIQRFTGGSSPYEPLSSSVSSAAMTPASDELNDTSPTDSKGPVLMVEVSELQKLRLELEEARSEVTRMNHEIHSQQMAKSTIEHLNQSSESEYGFNGPMTEQTIAQLQSKFNAGARSGNTWFNEPARPSYNGTNSFGAPYPNRMQPSPAPSTYRRNGFLNEPAHFPLDQGFRTNGGASGMAAMSHSFTSGMNHMGAGMSNPPSRPGSAFDPRYAQTPPMYASGTLAPIGTMGTRTPDEVAEFGFANSMNPSPWNSQASRDMSMGSYVSTSVEPMNYRRMLDRNIGCDWKHIVDKIICNNDQQASIFLQQKLKVGTPEQKYEIIEAIIGQAYPLMINRFGNFLVQRCFEHGTSEQIIAIAQTIRGNTLALSMDAFGCHVIQKAFDCVPEEYKATMVHELLRRIPETVIHRYACHVWQKLFELRWSDSPPQIMRYVNEALRGMWHEVALGETGSLVVQNIFENCLEEDKRPCINEVLASIDVIAHGQFGNWCIQHICEHGTPADRNRAIDHILRFATEYSMDQYASKVIEKCLKIGGPEFLEQYLDRICEGRADRPRMPLIDIAGDQFGNYLIQYILTNSSTHFRELVSSHIRKHMVSLRGSKYGSRVAMLCCNPVLSTRPGPPSGMVSRYNGSSTRATFGSFR